MNNFPILNCCYNYIDNNKQGSAIGYMFLIPTNFPTIVYRPPKIHVVEISILL